MNVRSKQAGNVLYNFLWIDLGLTLLLLINTMIAGMVGTGETFLNYNATISFVWAFINIIYGIIFLVWIFKVHHDLREVNNAYPIKPGGALARILIPFYNIYGLWNMYATMARFFQQNAPSNEPGTRLGKYIPIYYILLWGSTFINYFVTDVYINDAFNPLWFVSYVGDGALSMMSILIVQVISTGLWRLAAKESNHD